MLDFSIFKQKESHQSFGNIKAGGNQTAINIAQIQKLICNLILQQSLLDSAKSIPTLAQSGMNLLLVIYDLLVVWLSSDALYSNKCWQKLPSIC